MRVYSSGICFAIWADQSYTAKTCGCRDQLHDGQPVHDGTDVTPSPSSACVPTTPSRTVTSYTGILMPASCWAHSLSTGRTRDGVNVQRHAELHSVGCIKGCSAPTATSEGNFYILQGSPGRYTIKYTLGPTGAQAVQTILQRTTRPSSSKNYRVTVGGSWNGCILSSATVSEAPYVAPASGKSTTKKSGGSSAVVIVLILFGLLALAGGAFYYKEYVMKSGEDYGRFEDGEQPAGAGLSSDVL